MAAFYLTSRLMNDFFSILAQREWALFVLFVVFIMWTVWMPKPRKALGGVIRAFCNPKILSVLAIAAVCIFMLLFGLYTIGLWKVDDTAATVFWAVTSALISLLNFQKAQTEPLYYHKAVFEVFSLTTLFIFLADMVELSVLFWLLVIPAMTMLHLFTATAKLDPAHAVVAKLLEWVEIVAGLALFFIVVREAIASIDTFLNLGTLRLFGLSIVLSIAFLPFIAALAVYEPYERVFGILPLHIPDASLRRSARWRAIMTFRTDTEFLERWRRIVTTEPPTSLQEVKASFAKLRTVKTRERNPQRVAAQDGWSPQSAIRFLETKGLSTNDYHEDAFEHGEWWAQSGLIEFGQGPLHNNIAYYVYGTAEIVSRLKLKLNVNQSETADEVMERLSELACVLAGGALDDEWQAKLAPLLDKGTPFEVTKGGVHVTLICNDWHGGITGGHDITFEILRSPVRKPTVSNPPNVCH